MKRSQNGFGLIEGLLTILILAVIGSGSYFAWHNHRKSANPKQAFFQNILKVAPAYYTEQVKILGGTPVKSYTKPGCVETYQGYPPGEKSPSVQHPYYCSIHISKSYAAPKDKNKGSEAIKQFAKTARSEGFASKDGIIQNSDGVFYEGSTYYKGKKECNVSIAYYYSVPSNPGFNDGAEQIYLYDLACGDNTYPFLPSGYPVGTVPGGVLDDR